MNIGKLVRAKMKELSADLSGEYVDNQGKHFTMAQSDDGYTIKYGGGDKSVEISKETGVKLTGACRKI